MTVLLRVVRMGVIVATLVFAPAVMYLAPVFDSRSACERGSEWSRAHLDALPTTAAELAAFPESIRRSVFSELSPQRKATVWKEQVDTFVRNHKLSEPQAAAIQRLLSHIGPDLYPLVSTPSNVAAQNAMLAVLRDVSKVFPINEYRAIAELSFSTVTPKKSFASQRFAITEFIRSYATAHAIPMCNCKGDEDCAIGGQFCDGGSCSATWGCGGGSLKCDGECRYFG